MNDTADSSPRLIHDRLKLDVFAVGNFLGRGSFGECYVLKDQDSGKQYAGKILKKSMLQLPLYSSFILKELAIHRTLKHRNIVSFKNSFDDRNNIYMVLELCSNGSLVDLQRRRECLTLVEAKYYLMHILLGLQYLHSKNIVHGDLKLSNIFISGRMVAKIGDFGLANVLTSEGDQVLMCFGTPNYMAPEIVKKKGHSYAGDIWAVGCILYVLLVGKLPFQCGESRKETCRRIKNCEFSVYESGLRKQVSTFITKILRKEPKERPTIRELLQDEFLSRSFIPQSLPTSCLWQAPDLQDLANFVRLSRMKTEQSKSRTERYRMKVEAKKEQYRRRSYSTAPQRHKTINLNSDRKIKSRSLARLSIARKFNRLYNNTMASLQTRDGLQITNEHNL